MAATVFKVGDHLPKTTQLRVSWQNISFPSPYPGNYIYFNGSTSQSRILFYYGSGANRAEFYQVGASSMYPLPTVSSSGSVILDTSSISLQITTIIPALVGKVFWEDLNAPYTITYEVNGGEHLNNDVVEYPAFPNPLPTPVKIGHTFVSWYTDVNLTQKAVSGTQFVGNQTLYARWIDVDTSVLFRKLYKGSSNITSQVSNIYKGSTEIYSPGYNVFVITFQGTLSGINEVTFSSISIEFSNGDIVSFSPSNSLWIKDVPSAYKTYLGDSKLIASGEYKVYGETGSLYLIKNVLKITFYRSSTSWYLDVFYKDITFTGDLISTSIADTIQPAGGTSNLVYEVDRDIVIGALRFQECISANTQVLMADGTYKALGDIEVGDEILSYDWDTMTLISNPVIYSSKGDESFYAPRFWRWTFSDGTIIENAFSHRFYNLEAKKFVYLEYWNIGDHTVKEDGSHPYLVSVEKIYENFHYARITGQYGTNYFANGLLTGDRYCPDNLIL